MGTVYQALDTRLNRPVALKVLSPDQWEGTTGRGRLMREAQAASALNHPNIVTVYEIGHEAGVDFIAMECIEGKTLGSARAPPAAARDACHRYPDCRRPRRRPRRRHRASRSQTRQHHGHRARPGEDPGFRHRQGRRRRRCRIQRHPDPHPGRPRRRHRSLHVARTGRGQGCGLAFRHLLLRLRALRNGHGPPRLSRRHRSGHAGRRDCQGTRLRAPVRPRIVPGSAAHHRYLPAARNAPNAGNP